jgi:hypothetical protein
LSGLPSFEALHQIRASLQGYKNATYMKNLIYTSWLILKRIAEAAETISQQPGIFERTSQSLLRRHQLCIEVNGRTFEHPVSIGNKLQLFQTTTVVLLYFQPQSDPL